MKLQYLLAICLIFNGLSKTLNPLTAQRIFSKGQITTAEGQVLDGEILDASFQKIAKTIVFRAAEGSTETTFLPEQLQSFKIFPSQFFESKKIEFLRKENEGHQTRRSQQVFLRLLDGGEVRLYKFYADDYNYILYVSKDGGSLQRLEMVVNRLESTSARGRRNILESDTITVSRNLPRGTYDFRRHYFGVLQTMFSDCPDALLSDAPELEDSEILKAVRRYNRSCGKQPAPEIAARAAEKSAKRRFAVAQVGANFPAFSDGDKFKWAYGGVGFQMGNLLKNKRNTLEFLLHYHQFDEEFENPSDTVFSAALEFAVRGNVIFLQDKRLTPHLSLGFSLFTGGLVKYNLGFGGYYFFANGNFVRVETRPHFLDKNLGFFGVAAAVGFKI